MKKGYLGSLTRGRVGTEREILSLFPTLKAYAVSLCRSRILAEDLVHDTYVKAVQNIDKFEEGTCLRAWLMTILRNSYFSWLRKHRREVEMSEGVGRVLTNSYEHATYNRSVEDSDEVSSIIPFLAFLPQDQRDVVVGVHIAGMSYEHLAKALETEIGTIKSRCNRGLKALRHRAEVAIVQTYDLSAWKHATRGIPKDDPYYPIAKAYETLYASLSDSKRSVATPSSEVLVEDEMESAWNDLLESGALEEEPDFLELIQT